VNHDSDCPVRLLVAVGDDLARLLQQPGWLDEWGGEIIPARDTDAALVLIRQLSPALILVSAADSRDDTVQFVRQIRAIASDVPIVVVSRDASADDTIGFVRAGASDHIAKSLDKRTFIRLLEGLRLEENSSRPKQKRWFSQAAPAGLEIVGQSPGMTKCLEMVRLVSESRCNPVLVLGETGTGKEMIAQGVHWWRYGDFDKFIAVNCATLTANLMASELFGHVRGAFTGADRDKKGLFEEAENGSIFLDEISEMPLELQAQLLRVVQDRKFRKVGATRDIDCNATILASSNKDLLEEAEAGRFRQDLYYRLAVLPIVVPPIRCDQRRDDIGLLAEYFLDVSGVPKPNGVPTLSPDARDILMMHNWPGNVRELRNVMERSLILECGDEISASSIIFDQQIEDARSISERAPEQSRQDFSLEAAEREFIQRALEETGWQRTRAAALLGITRATLYAKLKRYAITEPDESDTSNPDADASLSEADGLSESRTMRA
jgi:DNA-binding NtrC family response regulator